MRIAWPKQLPNQLQRTRKLRLQTLLHRSKVVSQDLYIKASLRMKYAVKVISIRQLTIEDFPATSITRQSQYRSSQ